MNMILSFLISIALKAFATEEKIPVHHCPKGSVFVESHLYTACCVGSPKPEYPGWIHSCEKDGEEIYYYHSYQRPTYRKFRLRQYKNGKLNGEFKEFWPMTGIPRLVGEYRDGAPTGTWRMFQLDKRDPYVLQFGVSGLESITFPNGKYFKVANLDTGRMTRAYLGSVRAAGAREPHELKDTPHEFKFFYSGDKSKITGIAIDEYRFFSNRVLLGRDHENGTPHWKVGRKKGEMCQVDIFSYPKESFFPWVECAGAEYMSVVDELKNRDDLLVDSGQIFYEIPGEKAYRPNFRFDPIKFGRTDTYYVAVSKVANSKIIDGKQWVQIELGEEKFDARDITLEYLEGMAGVEPKTGETDIDLEYTDEAIRRKYELIDEIRDRFDKADIKNNRQPWIPLYNDSENILLVPDPGC